MNYDDVITCAVVGQEGAAPENAKEKINEAITGLFKTGYRRFLIVLTGEVTLLFAEEAVSFREQYPDMGIDISMPFDSWIDEQPENKRYRQIVAQAESVNYGGAEEYEDSVDICNHQPIGFGRCMVVIYGGGDKAMPELIAEIRDAEQEVKEILL